MFRGPTINRNGVTANGGDRRKILDGIERQILVKAGVDRLGSFVSHQQRISVRRRPRDRLGADHPCRASAVLDHDRLLPAFAELLSDGTREGVGCAAGGLWHDNADQSRRIIFRHDRLTARLTHAAMIPQQANEQLSCVAPDGSDRLELPLFSREHDFFWFRNNQPPVARSSGGAADQRDHKHRHFINLTRLSDGLFYMRMPNVNFKLLHIVIAIAEQQELSAGVGNN